jgi:hypothetical protein
MKDLSKEVDLITSLQSLLFNMRSCLIQESLGIEAGKRRKPEVSLASCLFSLMCGDFRVCFCIDGEQANISGCASRSCTFFASLHFVFSSVCLPMASRSIMLASSGARSACGKPHGRQEILAVQIVDMDVQ